MAFQRVPNGVEILIKGTMAGQEILNTFYGTMEGYVLADIEALAAALATWATTNWRPLMGTNYHFDNITVRGLNAPVDIETINATTAGAGTAEGEVTSNNCALSVKRSSGFTGRAARGRIYVPVTAAAIDPTTDTVFDAFAADILVALNAMDAVITANGFVPVIVHRVSAGVPLAEAVVFTLVEWVVVDKVIDSMRRRLPKRGV